MDEKLQKEMEEVAKDRGKIIVNFSFIELHLTSFIINHYLKIIPLDLQISLIKTMREEVFENENFSFWLKFNIFKNLLKKHYPEEEGKFPIGKMNELIRLRNIIAHGSQGIEANKTQSGEFIAKGEIIISHGGNQYKASEIIQNYYVLKDIIQPAIESLATRLGLNSWIKGNPKRID